MNSNKLYFYIAPYLIWMSLFFVIPTLLVIIVSFIDQASWDAIITAIRNFHPNIRTDGLLVALQKVGDQAQLNFTLDAYKELLEPRVTITIFRTFVISLISAIVCLLLSIPTAHYIS